MDVQNLPHYTLRPEELARWLLGQPESWWMVDGDPLLTSEVDFPCPGEELVDSLRRIDTPLIVFDPTEGSEASGQVIGAEQFDKLADVNNRRKMRTFLLSWAGSGIEWLLFEDTPPED